MTDTIKHIDLDDELFEDAPKALRDYAKSLKKQFDALTSDLDGARKQIASHALSGVLGDKGFKNPKRVEQDILRDGVDATDKAAVDAWLEANGDDYAKGEVTAETPAPVQQETEEQKAQREGYQALNAGDQLRNPAELSKFESAQAEITDDMDGAQVLAILRKHGV